MAQGPPLQSIGCSANLTPTGALSSALSPTCKNFSECQAPPAASTNVTARQRRHSKIDPECTVLLHPALYGAATLPEEAVDGAHCGLSIPGEAFARLKSCRDQPRTEAATNGLAARQFSIVGVAELYEEASWTQWKLPRLAGNAAEEPTGLSISRRRGQYETTDHAHTTTATAPLQGRRTRPVKESTLYNPSTPMQEAETTGGKSTNASPRVSCLSSAHDLRASFPEDTLHPSENPALLGAEESVAGFAVPKSTANTTALAPAPSDTCGSISIEARATLIGNASVASPARLLAFDPGCRNAALMLTLPKAPTAAPPLAIPGAAPAGTRTSHLSSAAPMPGAAAQCAGEAHLVVLHCDGEGVCQRSHSLIHAGCEGIPWNAEHNEAWGKRVTYGNAKRSSCLGEKGNTAKVNASFENVQRVCVDRALRDADLHSGNGSNRDRLSGVCTLGRCRCEVSGCPNRKGTADSVSGVTRRNYCSSSGSGSCSIGSSNVHKSSNEIRCVSVNLNNNKATSSSSRSNSNDDCCSGCGSQGNRQLHSSACPFTNQVDSCRSTTVSTPSPAASFTPRSIHSSPYEKEVACRCPCTTCASYVDRRSSEIGTACTETESCKRSTALVDWYNESSELWLKCTCSCTGIPTMPGSGSTIHLTHNVTTRAPLICMRDGQHTIMRPPHLQEVKGIACINQPTQRSAAADVGNAAHHRFSVVCKDGPAAAGTRAVEELLLPAAVVMPAGTLPREQQQRQLPQNRALPVVSNPLENALLQATASVTHVSPANATGMGDWFCNGSSSWGSDSNSPCSPPVFSHLPIVPLSAWPVPATHVCDDGVAPADIPTQRESRDSLDCSPCSRRCAELISCHSWGGDSKCEESLLHHERSADKSKGLLGVRSCVAQESRRHLLGRQPDSQRFARSLSGTPDSCRGEPVSPCMVKRPILYTKSPTNSAAHPTDTESGAAFLDGCTANASYPVVTAATSSFTRQSQLPFPSQAESRLFLPVGCASTRSMSRERVQNFSGVPGFCSSIRRTATLLLGDLDPEMSTAGAFNLSDSSNLGAQEHGEALYPRKACGNAKSKVHGANKCVSRHCDVKASKEESRSGSTASHHSDALEARSGHDDLQRIQALQVGSKVNPTSFVSQSKNLQGVAWRSGASRCTEETASCPETASNSGPALHVASLAAPGEQGADAPGSAVTSSTILSDTSPVRHAAEWACTSVQTASNDHGDSGFSTRFTTAHVTGTAFPQQEFACSIEQSCTTDRLFEPTLEERRQGPDARDQRQKGTRYTGQSHEEEEVSELQECQQCKQQEQERESKDGFRSETAKANAKAAAGKARTHLSAVLSQEAHSFSESAVQPDPSGASLSRREALPSLAQSTNTEGSKSDDQVQSCSAEASVWSILPAVAGVVRHRELLAHRCPTTPVKRTYNQGQDAYAPCALEDVREIPRVTTDAPARTRAAPAATRAALAIAVAASEIGVEGSLTVPVKRSIDSENFFLTTCADANKDIYMRHRDCETSGIAPATGGYSEVLTGNRFYEGKHTQLPQECVVAGAGLVAPGTPSQPRSRKEHKQGIRCTNAEKRDKSKSFTQITPRRRSRSSSHDSVSSTSTQSGLLSYLTSRSSSTRCSPLSSRRREPVAPPAAATAAGPPSAAADICVSAATLLFSIPTLNAMTLKNTEVHHLPETKFPLASRHCNAKLSVLATASADARLNLAAGVQWESSSFTEDLARVTRGIAAPQEQVEPSVAGKAAEASPVPVESPTAAFALKTDIRARPAQQPDWPHSVCMTDSASADSFAVDRNSSAAAGPQATVGLVAANASAYETVPCPQQRTAEHISSHFLAIAGKPGSCISESSPPATLESLKVLPCTDPKDSHHSGTPPFFPATSTLPRDEEIFTGAAEGAVTHESFLAKSASGAIALPVERLQKPRASVPPDEQRDLKLHLTLWTQQNISEHAHRRKVQHLPLSTASCGLHSTRSASCVKLEDPLKYSPQHLPHATQDEEALHYKRQESIPTPAVQQPWHQQSRKDQTQILTQCHIRRHPQLQRSPEGLLGHDEEGLLHDESLNTQPGSPTSLISHADCGLGPDTAEEDPGFSNEVEVKSNISPKSTGEVEGASQAKGIEATFAAQAGLLFRSSTELADNVACASVWTAASRDFAKVSSPSPGREDFGKKDAVVTDNNGCVNVQAVQNRSYAIDGSYQSVQIFAAASVQASTVRSVASRYPNATALSSATGYSVHGGSNCSFFKPHPSSPKNLHASCTDESLVSITAPSDLDVLPDPRMEVMENKHVQRQLPEEQIQVKPASTRFGRNNGQASQVPFLKFVLEGLQGPAALEKGSGVWLSTSPPAKTEPKTQKLQEGVPTADCFEENDVHKAETRNSQHPGPGALDDMQGEPAVPDARFHPERALSLLAEDGGGSVAAPVRSASGKDTVLLEAVQATASGTNADLKKPDYTDALEKPVYGGYDAPSPAGTHCIDADMAEAVLSISGPTDEKTEPGEEALAGAKDGYYGTEKSEREHLITMSDSRWLALRRSGLFRLGDKGRASIKSRIAKQLRLCPELRQAAAAIGGGGVRCATTRQLYQLAELCGFDDVLPPEFRRPRSSNEHHQMDSAAEESRATTRFGTTENTYHIRREKSSHKSCSAVLRSFSSSSKRCATPEGARARSSGRAVMKNVVSCQTALGVNHQEPCRFEANSPCSSLCNSLQSTHSVHAGKLLDIVPKQQPASDLEKRQQQEQSRHHPTVHEVRKNRRLECKEQTERRSPEAALMAQQNATTWPVSAVHSWEGQQFNDWQPHHEQEAQYRSQPPLHRQGQLYSPQRPSQQQKHSHSSTWSGHSQVSPHRGRYQQEHPGDLEQQQGQHRELHHHHARPAAVSQTLSNSGGIYNECGNASVVRSTTSAQHLQQQPFLPQMHQEGQQPQDLSGECYQQQQEPQLLLLRNLLDGESNRSHQKETLHHTYFQKLPLTQQEEIESKSAQKRNCPGDPHTYAATASSQAAIPLDAPAQSATELTPGAQASLDVNPASAADKFSAASVVSSATAHASVLKLLRVADDIATHGCTTSRTEYSSSTADYISEGNSNRVCTNTTGQFETGARKTDTPITLTRRPVKQDCHLHSPGTCADQQLSHIQQKHTRRPLSGLFFSGADERVVHEVGPSGVSDGAAVFCDRMSSAGSISRAAMISECGTGDPSNVSSYTATARLAFDRGVERSDSLGRAYPETDISPIEDTPPPAVGPCLFTKKVCALQQTPCLSVLSQSHTNSSPPGFSSLLWGGTGTSSTLTCGSCSTKSSRSCLEENARAMTTIPQREPNKEAVANVEPAAVQSASEGNPDLLPMSSPSFTTIAAMAKKCFSLPPAEQVGSCRTGAHASRSQDQEFEEAGQPTKRCRIEATHSALRRQCSTARANIVDSAHQHHSGKNRYLEEGEVVRQRYQPPKQADSGNTPEGCQALTVLSHVVESKQPQKDIDPHTAEPVMPQSQQQRIPHPQTVGPHVSQQRAWEGDSLCSPCGVCQLSDSVGTSMKNLTGDRMQMADNEAARQLIVEQKPHHALETQAVDFALVRNTLSQGNSSASMPLLREAPCSSGDSARFGKSDICSFASGGTSSTCIPTGATRVVDELFDVQLTSETNSPSDRAHLHHADANWID